MRVVRVWRHLALRRRSGQAQDIDSVITNRRLGSLAVRCPACPEIGFNVDKATVDAAPENKRCADETYFETFDVDMRRLRHKYTLFVSSDGNFKLQRKRKTDDPDDVALNGGDAYFPNDSKYQEYAAKIGPADDVCLSRRNLWSC